MLRSFSLEPRRLARRSIEQLAARQPAFNRLYDAVARDVEFVSSALGDAASRCAWCARELEVYRRVAARQASKPTLLLPNSVYLERDVPRGVDRFVLSVGNVQAGEPYQLQL
eukprot:1897669-Prymnesium_polylepis.1